MIEKNIQIIRKSISDKSLQCGRSIDEITLVAVSKQNSTDSIIEVTKYGLIDFGENKAQELKQKSQICSNNIKWHFIGHLQTNKVKDVVPFAYLIHSVDSIKLAKEINKRSANIGKTQNVLLEVNTSGEESKFGMKVDDQVYELATFCKNAENINLMGLMAMAPYTSNEDIVRNSFKSLKNIFIKLNNEGFELRELSMGMSNDFEIAIEEGATILRIGTAIFGSRY
jgi:PLP dependent protein